MPPASCPCGTVRPSSDDVQAQIEAYLDLPKDLRARLDPRHEVLAELQREWVRADREEQELAA